MLFAPCRGNINIMLKIVNYIKDWNLYENINEVILIKQEDFEKVKKVSSGAYYIAIKSTQVDCKESYLLFEKLTNNYNYHDLVKFNNNSLNFVTKSKDILTYKNV